jgi:hypothetical protein
VSGREQHRRGPSVDSGTVTAELAVALPGVVLLATALVVTGQAVIGEVRCTDAARAGARLAARGEPEPAVRAEAARRAPRGARVSVQVAAGEVRVLVTAPLGGPLPGGGALTMRGSAVAAVEAESA